MHAWECWQTRRGKKKRDSTGKREQHQQQRKQGKKVRRRKKYERKCVCTHSEWQRNWIRSRLRTQCTDFQPEMCTVTYVEHGYILRSFHLFLLRRESFNFFVLFYFVSMLKFCAVFQKWVCLDRILLSLSPFCICWSGWESLPLEKLNGIRIFIETLNHFIDIDGMAVVSIVDAAHNRSFVVKRRKSVTRFSIMAITSLKSKCILFYKLSDFITHVIIILMWHNFIYGIYTRAEGMHTR